MTLFELAAFAAAAVATAALTALVRARARARGQLDRPNPRSSHSEPVPRGGGVAIVVTCIACALIAAAMGTLPLAAAAALATSGLMVATAGYVDDLRSLPALPRLAVHAGAAIAALAILAAGGPSVPVFGALPPLAAGLLLLTGIVWSTNLFNFMDGIDGIAASQGAFVAGASAILMAGAPAMPAADLVLPLATAGACVGFLAWNRPPARIFMGDVGSGFLGCWLAVLAVHLHQAGALSIWSSAILGSAFIADATVTLLRRMIRGDRWREAHRSHAYQQLSRRWKSHGRVTALLWLLNAFVTFPLAALSVAKPATAPALAISALATFSLLVLLARAGRAEPRSPA